MVDFSKRCSVLFFFGNKDGKGVTMNYERPQYIDDFTLTEEAKLNAEDMIEKKLNGVQELRAIAIARSEIQRKDILNQASQRFKSE